MSVAGIKSAPGRDPLLGARIDGRYRIRAVHGRGGMGVVYSAVHEDLRRDVAVKVLDKSWATDRTAIERFLQEARTASGLSHGNIVDVLDLGRLPDGRPYLVMPLIIGSDLATVLAEEGPQHPKRVASLLGGVASALDLIHAKGLVHHDIKPENLMRVRREDGSETVVVLDFGIAGARFPLDGRGLELFDRGTPEFMPPEAAAGVVPDRRGDIYALATVSFELMTGRLPFESNDDAELATLKATRPPSSMTYASGMSFPLALEAVVARGLATRPAERYPTAGEFVRRLAHVAAQISDDFLSREAPQSAAGPVLQPPATRPQRRAMASRSRTLMGGVARAGASASAPPAGSNPVDAAARVDAAAEQSSLTAQTLPQMHAVSVAPSALGDSQPPVAEANAEASGARALPRAEQDERPSAHELRARAKLSKTATLGPGVGPLQPPVDPRAATEPAVTATETAPAPASTAPAAEAGLATGLEWGPAEASGTFLREDAHPDITQGVSPPPTAPALPGSAAPTLTERPRVSAPYSFTQPHGSVTAVSPKVDRPSATPTSGGGASSERPTSPGRTSSTFSGRRGTPRVSAPPISAPPPAAPAAMGAAPADAEDDPVLVVDANDTTATPFPPPPAPPDDPSMAGSDFADPPGPLARAVFDGTAQAPRGGAISPRHVELPGEEDEEEEEEDSEELDALYAMAQRDDRITDPSLDFRPRRSVLLHPAMLTVYAGALLFWLYAVLPDRDPQSEELPAASAASPLPPYAPPASAPQVASPPAAGSTSVVASAPTPPAVATAAAQADSPLAALRASAPQTPTAEPRVRRTRSEARSQSASADSVHSADSVNAPRASRRMGGAAELYDRAIAADSSYAPAFRGKGLVMERLGKSSKAADAFRTFLRLAPDSPSANKVRERLDALDAH